MKKIIVIVLIVVLAGLGGAYYFLRNSTKPATTAQQPVTILEPSTASTTLVATTTPQKPVIQTDAPEITEVSNPLIALSKEPIVGYWINQLDNQVYYLTPEGVVRRADSVGSPETITSSRFDGAINSVVASPHGDAIIIESGTPQNSSFKVLDVERHIWRALPAGTVSASWNPTGPTTEILYLRSTTDAKGILTTTINRYTFSKGTSKTITQLNVRGVDLTWITTGTAYLSQRPSQEVESSIWALDLKNLTLQLVFGPRKGLWVRWINASGGVGFDTGSGSYTLSTGASIEKRLLFATTPEKCTIEQTMLYCAIASSGLTNAQLPDKYLQRGVMSEDTIAGMDLTNFASLRTPKILLDAKAKGVMLFLRIFD
jgi:hypothetical protein